MAGVLIVVAALAALMLLAYRGWSILVLTPFLALAAVILIGEGQILASYTQIFMRAAGDFVVNLFPVFLLGALFGKVMAASGAAEALAARISALLGRRARDPRRGALLRGDDLWRHLGLRRDLRGLPDRRDPVPQGRHQQAADPLGDRARRLHLHHDHPARHAGGAERDPDAGLRHHGLRAAGAQPDRRGDDPRHRPVAPRLAAARLRAGLRALRGHARRHDDGDPPPWTVGATALGLVLVGNLVFTFLILPRMDFAYLAEPEWGATSFQAVRGLWAIIASMTIATFALIVMTFGRVNGRISALFQEGAGEALTRCSPSPPSSASAR
jgi:hypothetical protein